VHSFERGRDLHLLAGRELQAVIRAAVDAFFRHIGVASTV